EGRAIRERIPGAQFHCIDGAGHWPQWEQADAFNDLHLSFMGDTSSRRQKMIYEDERRALDAAAIGGAWRRGFDRLADLALESEALDPTVREVGLALTFAGRGMSREARRHGQRALDLGLTRPQAVEALVTGLLHGGYGIFWECAWMIEAAPAA